MLTILDGSAQVATTTHLSFSVENVRLSTISFSGIWKKAESLNQSEGHILKAPWIADEKTACKSSLSPQPRVVQTKSNNKFLCFLTRIGVAEVQNKN